MTSLFGVATTYEHRITRALEGVIGACYSSGLVAISFSKRSVSRWRASPAASKS
jgi:hypothetical protein